MIPQTFEYSAPKTLDEALGLLAEGAKPLAGGMSLIPMMKLRLAAPEHLVDLGKLKDLTTFTKRTARCASAPPRRTRTWRVLRFCVQNARCSRRPQRRSGTCRCATWARSA